ncbi:hypothetical protein C8F04DRAFT_1182076 [Mycena alexandri]|uniref:HAT C-terminal dimerisation domain-containing protein n=1 Tax=Mycena alexandri TaxID=1745969 RepID=A0AAD6X5L8_9AGAR|nr:hypothetical protein C8F04DRAFT_1182076 [Mycena alexandri]
MELEDGENAGFLTHAKETFNRRFIEIATPKHWLALFLHPSCCKLVLSGDAEKGRAQQWRWDSAKAKKLVEDLKAYNQFKSPFAGKATDAKEWWDAIPKQHDGVKILATVLHSIVAHSADVERLFSDLGGIQTPLRNGWLVETMDKVGRIRGYLSYLLFLKKSAEGKSTDLENPITWIPPLGGADESETNLEEDIVEKAYNDLQKKIADEEDTSQVQSAPQGSIVGGEMIDFDELERVDRRETDAPAKEIIDVVGEDAPGSWNIDDLMEIRNFSVFGRINSAIFCHILPLICPAILPFCLAVWAKIHSAPHTI